MSSGTIQAQAIRKPEAKRSVKERVLTSILQIAGTAIALLLPVLAWKAAIESRIENNAVTAQRNMLRIEYLIDDRKTNGTEVLSELKQMRNELSQMKVDLGQRITAVETQLKK